MLQQVKTIFDLSEVKVKVLPVSGLMVGGEWADRVRRLLGEGGVGIHVVILVIQI